MRRFAYLIAVALTLTACGGSDDSGGTTADSTSAAPGAPAAGASAAPLDTTPRPVPEGWTMGPLGTHENLSKTTPGTRTPVLQLISASQLETADRVTIEFATAGIPAYNAEYVTGPITECGSGKEVKPEGRAWLSIRIQPAAAHNMDGSVNIPNNEVALSGVNVKKAYLTCDFEGVVTVVIAMQVKTPFHISRMEGPTRMVIDILK